jgi:tRNA-splicing ligase RtcB
MTTTTGKPDFRQETMIVEDRPYREIDGIPVFGFSYDENAVKQIRTIARHGWVRHVMLCADNHIGFSMPIGGAASYFQMISPSGVGVDIGCGVIGVRTNLRFADLRGELPRIADGLAELLEFGTGARDRIAPDHSLFDSPLWQEIPYLTETVERRYGPDSLLLRARRQLGTIGGGNHYVDLLVDPETDEVWVACHFGSRGFGHGFTAGFTNLVHGKPFFENSSEDSFAPPVLLPLTTDAAAALPFSDLEWAAQHGQWYKAGMELAGEYAYAGRENVMERVLSFLGAEALETVHNHHNFSWTETHSGEEVEVIRKGATPAAPGQRGFVGGSMGDISVVVEGVASELSEKTLNSTVHGAGRVLGRKMAKGVVRKGKVKRAGLITRQMVAERLDDFRLEAGVPLEVRGGDVDESPFCYRPLDDVLAAHEGTIKVVRRLLPVVVCMSDREDPYRD